MRKAEEKQGRWELQSDFFFSLIPAVQIILYTYTSFTCTLNHIYGCIGCIVSEKLKNDVIIDQNIEGQKEDLELPLFDLSTICNATDNFSSKNKLGEGGFGPVYKVTLQQAV
jgi:hypothetical protein